MDWNSFFSAISQASAAIVGIILAFLIAKILNEVTDYDVIERDTEKLLLESQEIKILVNNLDFLWHDREIVENDPDLSEIIKRNSKKNYSNEEIIDLLSRKSSIYFPSKVIEDFRRKQRKHAAPNTINPLMKNIYNKVPTNIFDSLSSLDLPASNLEVPEFRPAWFNKDLNEFKDEVKILDLRTNILIKKMAIQQHSIDQNIKDLKELSNVLAALMPIIFITVIYPLHFMPVQEGYAPELSFSISNMVSIIFSIKSFFLAPLIISTTGIISYFWYVCRKHISQYEKVRKKINPEQTDITQYCPIFTLKDV
jgi:hypothetical protein